MVFKIINNFIGPNNFIPTLLVFRVYPRIVKSNIPNSIVIKRVVALKKAIKKVKKLKAKY